MTNLGSRIKSTVYNSSRCNESAKDESWERMLIAEYNWRYDHSKKEPKQKQITNRVEMHWNLRDVRIARQGSRTASQHHQLVNYSLD